MPARPLVYRLALSWVPRYAILFFIVVLYCAIYIYVRRVFKQWYTTPENPLASLGETMPSIITTQSLTPEHQTRLLVINRQLKYLFIYPICYFLMWLPVFASQCLQYSDYFISNPVFPLSVLSAIFLPIHACVDVIIFFWREKPWTREALVQGSPRWLQKAAKGIRRPKKANARHKNTADSEEASPTAQQKGSKPPRNWWDNESA